jgi:hypothetical protein
VIWLVASPPRPDAEAPQQERNWRRRTVLRL